MNLKDQRVCNYCMSRAIKRLYKVFLNEAEDLVDSKRITETEFEAIRKKILDCGNDQIRDAEEFIKNYSEISFKDGTSEFSTVKSLAEHVTNLVANAILEWQDNLNKKEKDENNISN
jgi:hypothetical protein